MYTQTEKVNIEPKSYLPVFRISQNDVGRTLKAHLVSDEGTITIPVSATVTMAGIKPSGLGYTVTGTINGSDVTFETNATMTDEAGQIESEIRIVDGETLIGTTNVVLNIEPNPHPDDVTDGQREPLVNEITALLNQITAQADRTEEYSSKVLNMTVSAHESQEPTVTKTEGEVVNLDFGLPRGEKGERGERGEQGEAGKDGKDGIDGKDGKDGINGVTPDFSIGTVTTLEPNESASVTLTGTEEEPVLNFGIPKGAKGEQGEVSLSDLEKIMVTDTANGAIASFPDGSDLLPAKSLVANIVPKQSGSGTPSPDNIRPISGWESVETSVCGKNLFNKANVIDLYCDGSTRLVQNATFKTVYIPLQSNASYVYTQTIFGNYTRLALCNSLEDQTSIYKPTTKTSGYAETTPLVFTNTDFKYLVCTIYRSTTDTNTFDEIADSCMLEEGTTATAYEPCTATTHTTDLGRTVYGGSVDVVSGNGTSTMGMVDLGSLTWYYDNNGGRWEHWIFFAQVADKSTATQSILLSSIYPQGAFGDNKAIAQSGNAFIYIRDDDYTSVADFKTAMSGVQLCYELATPQTYTLTPQTINTLAGVNNVWADSGDCSITYYADTKLYIDKKLGGN